MSSKPTGVGFVGLSAKGWGSMALAPSLLDPSLKQNYSIEALCTTSESSAVETAQKYTELTGHPVKPFYGDTSKIANDPAVDLVVVSVKVPYMKKSLMPAIEAKKDFFVEWPVGMNLQEVTEVAETARSQGVRGIVGMQGRLSPIAKKMKEIITSGKLGTIRSSAIVRPLCVTLPVVAIGHQLDVLTHLLSDFASLSATATIVYPTATVVDDNNQPTGETRTATSPDHIAVTGLLKSGVLTSITWRAGLPSAPGRKHLEWVIEGEDGTLRLEGHDFPQAFLHVGNPELYLNGELVQVGTYPGPGGNFVGNLVAAWTEFANGGEGNYASIDDGMRIHKLLDAISRSAAEGRKIDV
ncbi:NAD(P)-binding protein [Heliocybe sulcata]|uniref:NAD(P)-binding protein n=1 Tax=Heliocybe sulcata TaxID=5364 RepID=A0A5C3N953_9AGAM|nr:NAD(P)-binding protein [Heliocybe sulcata]